MEILKTIGKACTVAVLFVAAPVYAQDKMVDALPIARKLRALDSISIARLQAKEVMADAELADLYPSWTNNFETYSNAVLPKEYAIDLRGFHMPCDSRRVTSHYGYRSRFRRVHYGTDIGLHIGDTIRAAFDGKVRVVKFEGSGYGKYVVIRHPNGLETLYAHMSKQLVKADQMVKAGEPIGLGGSTGRSTGPHLHFETRFLGKKINPEILFSFENRDVKGDTYIFRSNGRSAFSNALAHTNIQEEEVVADASLESSDAGNDQRHQAKIYKVRKGDTLSKIAKKYGTTVESLCRLNNIPKNRTLSLGQVIRCS